MLKHKPADVNAVFNRCRCSEALAARMRLQPTGNIAWNHYCVLQPAGTRH
jgi:hypothetical protein